MHSYSYTGFEVGVEAVPADHIERNGTVCKKHLSGLRIDTGRIGLEPHFQVMWMIIRQCFRQSIWYA